MKPAVALLALLATAAIADSPRVSRGGLERIESAVESALTRGPYPSQLAGNTQGVYLDGVGAVFLTRIALVPTPMENPFHVLTEKEKTDIHDRKLAQIPRLKDEMRELLSTMAASPELEGVRANEQVVCGVTMFYYRWEKVAGLPYQIVMQAEKQQLLDVRAGRVPAAKLDDIVKVQVI